MSDRTQFFKKESWTAGVIGLGYVGLPLLVAAHSSGLRGVGFDVSEDTVRRLRSGSSHVDDVSNQVLEVMLSDGVVISAEPSSLAVADAIFICVPSPLGKNRQPDLRHIEAAANTIVEVVRPGQLVVLESTTYPGTTDEYLVPAIEKAGLLLDENVWVAYSPERISPATKLDMGSIPKVVGGVTPESGEVAAAACSRIFSSVHVVSSARTAEMSKLLENTYRAVNIGLINEIAQLSHELDIDIWEVIDAAATKPFGFHAFYPGPGVGGHCIPLDPQYLAWRAREANFATRFIETADQVNAQMPAYTARRIAELLNRSGKAVRNSRILIVGLAYKSDVSDDRESASVEVALHLQELGARVSVLDDLVDPSRIGHHGFSRADSSSNFDTFDVAAVLTDHSDVDYARIADSVPAVFDARGIYRRLGIQANNVEVL